MLQQLPTIALQHFFDADPPEQARLATEVDHICREIGFLIVVDHGVDKALIQRMWQVSRAFFDLPVAQKQQVQATTPNCPRGYFPLDGEALAKSLGDMAPPDLKEGLSVGPMQAPDISLSAQALEFHYGDNLWPAAPAHLHDVWREYWSAMERLANRLMQVLAVALELPIHHFDAMQSHPVSAMRALNYPATQGTPLPNQFGAGAHSDYGTITILKTDPAVGGLQVRLPNNSWLTVPPVEDGFVINVGDLFARWTNDRWVSTLHRVLPVTERRQSIAFFHNVNVDTEVACLETCLDSGKAKYAPILAGDYLYEKFTATQTTSE